ncbi:hypothetical protein HG536_0B01650 [Torulaspora globosa]|uniref:Conserved oligomeric Golgi complex subunit 4 n=1 Tax=Torulaspora globosa TaxID=48254 RepID=A0A7G3ZCR6_9SACH|nr:uncharacterized protein HG536_0B01650 [Torulaspora globosa]QLL31302.1 hypothetical protein HG536_0B01650 [Torulaspora globosa]
MSSNSSSSWDTDVLEGQLFKKLTKYSLYLQKLSTASQVKKLSQIIERDHEEQLRSLDQFIQESQTKHNRAVRSLELQRTDLTTTLSKYHTSLTAISNSNVTATAIHDDIVTVEREDLLIKKTFQFVQSVSILKNNISVIHSALEARDHQLAAKSIHEIRSLPKEIVGSEFAKKVVPTSDIPEEPAVLIEKWCSDLTDIFKADFLEAAKAQDIPQLTLIFKMFPLIGQNSLGLDLYSKYVCGIIAEESRKIMTMEAKKRGVFAQALLHLFKIVSTIINDHSKVISACYGDNFMIHVMEKVQKEADLQAGLILDTFNETRKVDRITRAISSLNLSHQEFVNEYGLEPDTVRARTHKMNDQVSERDGGLSDISDITDVLSEFSQMLQNWSMYSRFFSVRWYEFLNVTNLEMVTPPPPIADSQYFSKLQKDAFYANFEILVTHCLEKSFKQSLSLEELPSINDLVIFKRVEHTDIFSYPVSSILDDLSLLIRKNLILTLNTGQTQIFSRFLDQIAKFYQNEYLVRYMQTELKNLQSRLNSSLVLKKYVPKAGPDGSLSSRAASPSAMETYATNKLSQFGFNFRGAAANALTNFQSNLQAVVSDEDAVLSLHHYLIYVNTLYMNPKIAHRLFITEILEENPRLLHDNFPFGTDADILAKKVASCEALLAKQTNKLQKWSIKFLFENVLANKIRTILSNILINSNDNHYISGADDYDDLSTVHEFISKWNTHMVPYENILTKDAFLELLSLIVNCIIEKLEQRIWALQVNELGATKLDRELSLLIATVCQQNYALREKFAKLTQLVLILGFDDDDFDVDGGDLKEEISNDINWVISPQERVKARSLKIDRRH